MPVVKALDFIPDGKYKNGHYNTLISNVFGRRPNIMFERSRIDTPDDDFLDLDFIRSGASRLMVLCHGLEGSSASNYILVFAEHFHRLGWDILAMNYRGCSGEMNKQLQMYNSGSSGDLHLSIESISSDYDEIVIVGFSLGGNITLKYLGERIHNISDKIKAAVAISTPVHLSDASQQLLKRDNFLYQIKFVTSLSKKIIKKKRQFPDKVELRHLLKTTNLYKFDDYYTAPIFGYENAEEYYAKNQSIQWLHQIEIPSLIINAEDDPFLGPLCYPTDLVSDLQSVHLCVPKYGGHVGFVQSKDDRSWLLEKVARFIEQST